MFEVGDKVVYNDYKYNIIDNSGVIHRIEIIYKSGMIEFEGDSLVYNPDRFILLSEYRRLKLLKIKERICSQKVI